jgi:hypothetical protein
MDANYLHRKRFKNIILFLNFYFMGRIKVVQSEQKINHIVKDLRILFYF